MIAPINHQRGSGTSAIFLHPFRKPKRCDHGRDKQTKRTQRQHGARQPVDAVHENIEPAFPRLTKLFLTLGESSIPNDRIAFRAFVCRLHENTSGFADQFASFSEENIEPFFDQPYTATLDRNSASVMW